MNNYKDLLFQLYIPVATMFVAFLIPLYYQFTKNLLEKTVTGNYKCNYQERAFKKILMFFICGDIIIGYTSFYVISSIIISLFILTYKLGIIYDFVVIDIIFWSSLVYIFLIAILSIYSIRQRGKRRPELKLSHANRNWYSILNLVLFIGNTAWLLMSKEFNFDYFAWSVYIMLMSHLFFWLITCAIYVPLTNFMILKSHN